MNIHNWRSCIIRSMVQSNENWWTHLSWAGWASARSSEAPARANRKKAHPREARRATILGELLWRRTPTEILSQNVPDEPRLTGRPLISFSFAEGRNVPPLLANHNNNNKNNNNKNKAVESSDSVRGALWKMKEHDSHKVRSRTSSRWGFYIVRMTSSEVPLHRPSGPAHLIGLETGADRWVVFMQQNFTSSSQ